MFKHLSKRTTQKLIEISRISQLKPEKYEKDMIKIIKSEHKK